MCARFIVAGDLAELGKFLDFFCRVAFFPRPITSPRASKFPLIASKMGASKVLARGLGQGQSGGASGRSGSFRDPGCIFQFGSCGSF